MTRNRQNGNRGGGPGQHRNQGGAGPAPLTAPFRFARIARWIYEPDWAPLVSHDVPFADGLCGEAEVEITAKSSILVGGDRRKPSGGEAGEVRPFRLPDGDYAIPGSALQGMARAILEVAAFGRLGPWVEDRKFGIHDLLENSCPGHTDGVAEMKLDLPHLLFGVAAESDGGLGLKRRASFSLARAVRVKGKPPEPVEPEHPSVLLGPKPSYVGFYVRQKGGGGRVPDDEPMATYTPLEGEPPHLARPELAGVKIWPARGACAFKPGPIENEQIAGNPKIQTRLVTLPPGTRFRSRLNFHNLRPVELGAVLWALSFGDEAAFGGDANAVTKRHRLGMGKPLGLGEIAIRIAGLEADPACPAREPDLPKPAMEFVRAFEDHMRSAYGKKWRGSKQVAALLKAADPKRGQSLDLQYMPLRDYQDAKKKKRYMPDYAPGGDEKPQARSSPARKVGSGGVPAADLPLEEGARVRGKATGPTNIRDREGVVIALGATEYDPCQVQFDDASHPEAVKLGLLKVIARPSDSHTDRAKDEHAGR